MVSMLERMHVRPELCESLRNCHPLSQERARHLSTSISLCDFRTIRNPVLDIAHKECIAIVSLGYLIFTLLNITIFLVYL